MTSLYICAAIAIALFLVLPLVKGKGTKLALDYLCVPVKLLLIAVLAPLLILPALAVGYSLWVDFNDEHH